MSNKLIFKLNIHLICMSQIKLYSGCELECETSYQLARKLDMKNWRLSKNHKIFIALRF